MSATTTRLPRAQATALAWELLMLLEPYCERLEVLGSIRRQRPDCGDIELLAIPKTEPSKLQDMFGKPTSDVSALDNALLDLLRNGDIDKRQPARWGDRYKAFLFDGFPVDLFICLPPAQWGVLSIIRTGSSGFAKRLVTPVEKGGWMPKGMYCEGGSLWATGPPGGARIGTPEEADVFAAIGRPYIAPELREAP